MAIRILVAIALLASNAASLKVTVMGGTGFVGSRVVKSLVEQGASVTSVSASGMAPSDSWAQSVEWQKCDLTRGPREQLAKAIGSPDVVVSCVGAIGFDRQGLLLGNGVANVEAARAAKVAGAKRFVYVSVSDDVTASRDWLPDFFAGYFDGKKDAEDAILEANFDDGATFLRPSFIYGGDSFGLFPPRVNGAYGSAVEEILSSAPIVALANLLPGLLKVALRPPVSVEAVAGAAASAAQGKVGAAVLEGTTAINDAAGMESAKGLTEFIEKIKTRLASE